MDGLETRAEPSATVANRGDVLVLAPPFPSSPASMHTSPSSSSLANVEQVGDRRRDPSLDPPRPHGREDNVGGGTAARSKPPADTAAEAVTCCHGCATRWHHQRRLPPFTIDVGAGRRGRRLRVLFIHGLESGPKGRRAVALGRHFECLTPWMRDELEPLVRWRRSRVVQAGLALAVFLLALTLVVAYATHNMGGLMVSVPTVLVCLAAAFFVVQQVLLKFVAHPAINGCLDKQRAAILNFQPDVVVGSSWGGGIATYLMMEGSWRGPTILLAPAGGVISRWARFISPSDLHIPPSVAYARIVHSKLDRIVPYQDTLNLIERSCQMERSFVPQRDPCELSNQCCADDIEEKDCHPPNQRKEVAVPNIKKQHKRIELTLVDDDDHPLSRTMREERLREAIIEAYTFASSGHQR